MPWISYFTFGIVLAFLVYGLDFINKLQQDVKFIRMNIEKMNP